MSEGGNMTFDKELRLDNIELLFEAGSHSGDFIAAVGDDFTEYKDRKEFNYEWAWTHPAGRYVISVFQRCSVFIAGKAIWKNKDRLNEAEKDSRYKPPRFVIVLDQKKEYMVPSWGRTMWSHFVRSEKDPLHPRGFSGIEKAELAARRYSEQGVRAAVLECLEDFDMF